MQTEMKLRSGKIIATEVLPTVLPTVEDSSSEDDSEYDPNEEIRKLAEASTCEEWIVYLLLFSM